LIRNEPVGKFEHFRMSYLLTTQAQPVL